MAKHKARSQQGGLEWLNVLDFKQALYNVETDIRGD